METAFKSLFNEIDLFDDNQKLSKYGIMNTLDHIGPKIDVNMRHYSEIFEKSGA